MSETVVPIALSSVLTSIKKTLDGEFGSRRLWIKAEISNLRIQGGSGHCYLDLVETKDKQIIAQAKANIWAGVLSGIKKDLQQDFGNILKNGTQFLCQAQVIFSEKYGLSFNILKVDLNFSLGDMEKRRQETINKLKAEGILDRNKTKSPPLVIRRIALITSPGTAAYEDFYKQLNDNAYGYAFDVYDFTASVQGENAVSDICRQLDFLMGTNFDVVAIIRGGGSKLDLSCFDNYEMAKAIALHDLPVFVGVGHEIDFGVADMVACLSHKTPTALGAYIVDQTHAFENKIKSTIAGILEIKTLFFDRQKASQKLKAVELVRASKELAQFHRKELTAIFNRICTEATSRINNKKNELPIAFELIKNQPGGIVQANSQKIKNVLSLISVNFHGRVKSALEQNNFLLKMVGMHARGLYSEKNRQIENVFELLKAFHPRNILEKGYAIPRFNGALLTDQELAEGDNIEIELSERKLIASFLKWS